MKHMKKLETEVSFGSVEMLIAKSSTSKRNQSQH